jgi:hypothetical protein
MAMVPRLRRLIRTNARVVASRVVLVVAALTILLGVLRGGSRFFYCPIMHLAFDAPCCDPPRTDASDDARDALEAQHPDDSPSVSAPDCCQEKRRGVLPAASIAPPSESLVPPAGLVTLVRAADVAVASTAASAAGGRYQRAVRAGPSPPSASDRRAELMVFHI